MTKKSQAPAYEHRFRRELERLTGKLLKELRCDNAPEFLGRNLAGKLRKKGVHVQSTVPYNPEQNGKAERMNRVVV